MEQTQKLLGLLAEYRRTGDDQPKLDLLKMLAERSGQPHEILLSLEKRDRQLAKVVACLRIVEIDQRWIGSRELGPGKTSMVAEQAYSNTNVMSVNTEMSVPTQ